MSVEHHQMTTKIAFTTYKPHMSREGPLIEESASGARPGAPTRAPGVGSRRIPGLVFAPVRPGIVAACMVEPLDSGGVPGTDRPRWIGQSETDKRNILPMTGKACTVARRFETFGAGRPDGARDLPLATLSSNTCVQSNIFEFVMT